MRSIRQNIYLPYLELTLTKFHYYIYCGRCCKSSINFVCPKCKNKKLKFLAKNKIINFIYYNIKINKIIDKILLNERNFDILRKLIKQYNKYLEKKINFNRRN